MRKKITSKSVAQKFELKWSFGGPLSKLCVTPPFSINFRCQIKNQVSDYRLLGASSFMFNGLRWEVIVHFLDIAFFFSFIGVTVELVQSNTWVFRHMTKIYSPKVFLLTKLKPEYSDILYNRHISLVPWCVD
jgi:hypothetical protein